jgi:hypothetical protein
MVRPSTPPKSSFKEGRIIDRSPQSEGAWLSYSQEQLKGLVTKLPAGVPTKVNIMLSLMNNNPSGVIAADIKKEVIKFGYSDTNIATHKDLRRLEEKGFIKIGKAMDGSREVQSYKITSLGEKKLSGEIARKAPVRTNKPLYSSFTQTKIDKITDPKQLDKLSSATIGDVRESVTMNRNTSRETLVKLAKDPSATIRYRVTEHPNTPRDLVLSMANDESELVRSNIARRKDLPRELLVKFANDPSEEVRGDLAGNWSTPVDMLEKLSNDKSVHVLLDVITNPKTTPSMLRKIYESPLNAPHQTKWLNAKDDELIGKWLVENEKTPADIFNKIVNVDKTVSDWSVKRILEDRARRGTSSQIT